MCISLFLCDRFLKVELVKKSNYFYSKIMFYSKHHLMFSIYIIKLLSIFLCVTNLHPHCWYLKVPISHFILTTNISLPTWMGYKNESVILFCICFAGKNRSFFSCFLGIFTSFMNCQFIFTILLLGS